MIGRDLPGFLWSLCSISVSDWRASWRFGASFCRPSAHCSHPSPADSGALEAKLSPAIRTSKLEPKRVKNLEIDNEILTTYPRWHDFFFFMKYFSNGKEQFIQFWLNFHQEIVNKKL
jgi:hypothetical protein